MDAKKPDMISSLKDLLLIMIISFLPFKDAVRTTILSKRWRNLCYQNRNIVFLESDFIDFAASEEIKLSQRMLFVRFMSEWVSRFHGDEIKNFEMKLSKPMDFKREIKSLIRFAVSKKVKNLVLDFYDSENERTVIDLPTCAYGQTKLESLKLYACGLVASSFTNLTSLRKLSLGWLELGSVKPLLLNIPSLESLTLIMCWNVDLVEITNSNQGLKELILDNCKFTRLVFYFDIPNLEVFKYSGGFRHFFFERVNRKMQETCLDFGFETEFAENGDVLSNLLYDLMSTKNLTVCSYLLQVVPMGEDPLASLSPLETRHLTLKASFYPCEYVGMRFMLRSCPILETLVFETVPPRNLENYYPPYTFHPDTFWEETIIYRCLKNTLKVVEVKGFRGTLNNLHVIQYLVRLGRVMKRLELYIPTDIDHIERNIALAGANMVMERFRRASKNLIITVHD